MMEVVISPIARRLIAREASASVDGRETGGLLLGFDPDRNSRIVITQAGDAGPAAIRRPDFFNRDLGHAQELAEAAYRLDHSVWIGDWHTHPMGGAEPSWKDLDTYGRFLAADDLGFVVFVAIIVNPDPIRRWETPILNGWTIGRDRIEAVPIST